jgi:hypothetical protein
MEGVHATVVGVSHGRREDIPVILAFADVSPQRGEDCPVVPFHLAVALRVIGRSECLFDT